MIFTIHINEKRITGKRNPMIYGHFIEHFHRQIYDGIYDPENPLSDEEDTNSDSALAGRMFCLILSLEGCCWKTPKTFFRQGMAGGRPKHLWYRRIYKTLQKTWLRTLYLYKCRNGNRGGDE